MPRPESRKHPFLKKSKHSHPPYFSFLAINNASFRISSVRQKPPVSYTPFPPLFFATLSHVCMSTRMYTCHISIHTHRGTIKDVWWHVITCATVLTQMFPNVFVWLVFFLSFLSMKIHIVVGLEPNRFRAVAIDHNLCRGSIVCVDWIVLLLKEKSESVDSLLCEEGENLRKKNSNCKKIFTMCSVIAVVTEIPLQILVSKKIGIKKYLIR